MNTLDVGALVAKLRERMTLRYIGDCKCKNCQLVNFNDLEQTVNALAALEAERKRLEDALRQIRLSGVERDVRYAGMNARDIAGAALTPQEQAP